MLNISYTHWITQYYPGAANYILGANPDKNNGKITSHRLKIDAFANLALGEVGRKIRFGQPTRNPRYMTPLDYWFATQTDVASQLELNYFNQYLDLIDRSRNEVSY